MGTTKTDDHHDSLDPQVIDQLFATIGQSSRSVSPPPPQPSIAMTANREHPLIADASPRPVPRRVRRAQCAEEGRSWRDWLPTVWLVGCLLVAGFCFLMGMPNSPLRKTTVGATVAKYLEWIAAVGAKEGGTFFLDLPEMGAVGDAYVETILPCPPIEQGPGNVVTGVFAHEADSDTVILSVTFANGAYIKGVTDNHPFFSVNQNEFVAIGKMREGDYVKINDGMTRITKIDSRFAYPGGKVIGEILEAQHNGVWVRAFKDLTGKIIVNNGGVL